MIERQIPSKAIRKNCLMCAESKKEIRECAFDGDKKELCALWKFRMGPGGGKKPGSRVKAIRKYCLWCCCGSYKEVRLCVCVTCPLWIYRFGVGLETAIKKGHIDSTSNTVGEEEQQEDDR